MTNNQHGQVPEALIDLIDAYAETRHRCGGVYNAKTEAARKAVIEDLREALGGVQALSAGPMVTSEQRRLIGVIADKIEDGTLFQSGIYPKKDLARFVRHMLDTTPTAPAASPTPPAEQPTPNTGHAEADRLIGRLMSSDPDFEDCRQAAELIQREIKGPDGFGTWREAAIAERLTRVNKQAAPKAAPGELHDHQILAITTAYEQGVGKGRQAHESGKEIANPYDTGYRCDLAWQYGYEEGKKQAERIAEAASKQEAQEPALWMNEKGHTWSHSDWKQFPKHRAKYPIPLYPHFPATQPAPAPLSEQIDKLERKLAIIAVVGVIDGHDVVRRESVLEIARRAALAAQGGRDAG